MRLEHPSVGHSMYRSSNMTSNMKRELADRLIEKGSLMGVQVEFLMEKTVFID